VQTENDTASLYSWVLVTHNFTDVRVVEAITKDGTQALADDLRKRLAAVMSLPESDVMLEGSTVSLNQDASTPLVTVTWAVRTDSITEATQLRQDVVIIPSVLEGSYGKTSSIVPDISIPT
jgi:hypothetical protein